MAEAEKVIEKRISVAAVPTKQQLCVETKQKNDNVH